jgi:gliding motility-associated-like protein
VAGGTPPYVFQWSNGVLGQEVTNLQQGVFFVTVTDANGCQKDRQITVSQGVVLSIESIVDASCDDPAGGSATVGVPQGIGPLSYRWSDGQTTQTASNLSPGMYTVTVTDGAGCSADATLKIQSTGGGILLALTASPAGCTSPVGSATATVLSGGSPPYTYLWSDPQQQTTPTASGLSPGIYTVTVSSAGGCVGVADIEVENVETIQLTTASTPAGCAGTATGTITVSIASGGVAPFTFLWNDPQQQTTATATGLPAGSYSVTVTDANGCTAARQASVSGAPAISILVNVQNADCQNTTDGQATVVQVSAHAVPPFNWLWSTGVLDSFIVNVLPGNYGVTVTDAQGCTGAVPVTIGANASVSASFDWEISGCPGDTLAIQFNDGSAFSPPTNPLVSWNWTFTTDEGTQFSTLQNPTLTTADTLFEAMLWVENATGCQDSLTRTVAGASAFVIEIQSPVSGCAGDTIQLTALFNPNDDLHFQWSGGSPAVVILGDTLPSPGVVVTATGAYTVFVLVENESGCTFSDSVMVTASDPGGAFDPSLVSYTQCEGTTVDFINNNAQVTGYQWFFDYPNDPSATSTAQNPSYTYPDTGSYTVAIVALSNCVSDTFFFDVEVKMPPVAAFSWENTGCAAADTLSFFDQSMTPGAITAWHWQFSNGSASDLQNPVVVIDQSQVFVAALVIEFETGCELSVMDTVNVSVFHPSFLQDTVVACRPERSVQLNPAGDPNLTYQWSPAAGLDDPTTVNPVATVVQTTTYSVTISDNNGAATCTSVQEITVFLPDSIGLSLPEDIVACETGVVTLMAQAAVSPANFLWSSQPDFSDVLSQTDSLTITTGEPVVFYVQTSDAFGCTEGGSVTAGVYPINIQVPDFQDICKGGIVVVDLPGQSDTDSLTWQPFNPTGQVLEDTATFVLTIFNTYGCSKTDTLTFQPLDLSQLISVLPALDTIVRGQSVELSVTAGFDHTCNWQPAAGLDDPFDCSPVATPEETVTYTVEVEDPATGCRGKASSTICVVGDLCDEPMIFVPNAFTPNGDGKNDVLYVRGFNISRVHLFAIFNRWGEKVFESRSLNEGWDGTFNNKNASGDVFAYILQVECFSGERFDMKGNVTVIR